jgi:hypothetical protein
MKDLKDKLNKLLIILHDEAWKQSLFTNKPNVKLNINSFEMEIRKSLNYLLFYEEMEDDFFKLIEEKFSKEEKQKIIDTLSLIKLSHK